MNKLDLLAEWSTKWVERNGLRFYWEVEGHPYKFCNKHLANWYERERNCWAAFVDQQFSSIKDILADQTLDVDHNYNADYLHKLREEHDYIQFFFSGGSDSITVLEEAVEQDIFLDEIISLYIENIDYDCNKEIVVNAMPYIAKHSKSYGKFTLLNTSFDLLADHFKDPYGFFTLSTAMAAPLNIGRPFMGVLQRHEIANSCYIKCSDKPTVVHHRGEWYATFLDGSYGGENAIRGLKYFWLEADNIKSFVKDARVYRDYVKDNHVLDKTTQFFKANPKDTANALLRTNPGNMQFQMEKNYGDERMDEKYALRFMDAIKKPHYDLLIGYFKCLDKFFEIFPETRTDGFTKYNACDRFAWFINIDTLEVFSQQELIPNGFTE